MCQEMPTGLDTRWGSNEEEQKFKARQNRAQTFGKLIMSHFQATRLESIIESYYNTRTKKKTIASVLMVIAIIVKLFSKKWVVFSITVLAKKARTSPSDNDTKRGIKKKEMDEFQKDRI